MINESELSEFKCLRIYIQTRFRSSPLLFLLLFFLVLLFALSLLRGNADLVFSFLVFVFFFFLFDLAFLFLLVLLFRQIS